MQRVGLLKRRPALSSIYSEWYELVRKSLSEVDGTILELGSGGGFIKKIVPTAVTSDVLNGINVDIILDAKSVGDRFPRSISNLVLINVFHHINDSAAFLDSAIQALKPGGRILMVEPSCNAWSRLVYSVFPHEPFRTDQIGWTFESRDPLRDSNQAQSWIVFNRDALKFNELYPGLRVVKMHSMMPLSYIITGGFSFNFRIPKIAIRLVRIVEKRFFDAQFGLFAFIVLERARLTHEA